MSMFFSSGCRFFILNGGFIKKSPTHILKIGSISTDLIIDNALNDFEDKQSMEENLKKQGFVLGIHFEKRF